MNDTYVSCLIFFHELGEEYLKFNPWFKKFANKDFFFSSFGLSSIFCFCYYNLSSCRLGAIFTLGSCFKEHHYFSNFCCIEQLKCIHKLHLVFCLNICSDALFEWFRIQLMSDFCLVLLTWKKILFVFCFLEHYRVLRFENNCSEIWCHTFFILIDDAFAPNAIFNFFHKHVFTFICFYNNLYVMCSCSQLFEGMGLYPLEDV